MLLLARPCTDAHPVGEHGRVDVQRLPHRPRGADAAPVAVALCCDVRHGLPQEIAALEVDQAPVAALHPREPAAHVGHALVVQELKRLDLEAVELVAVATRRASAHAAGNATRRWRISPSQLTSGSEFNSSTSSVLPLRPCAKIRTAGASGPGRQLVRPRP